MFKASQQNKPLFNLTKEQVDRLIKIKKDRKLIIVASDKGLGPAVMEIKHYIFLALNHHLNNKNNYKELTKNEARIINHTKFLWICEQFIDRKKDPTKKNYNNISKLEYDFFLQSLCGNRNANNIVPPKSNLQLPYFYILPKVHKTLTT